MTLVEAAAAGLRAVCSHMITREASEPLPEALTYFSLRLSTRQWAEKVLDELEKAKITHKYAYKQVKEVSFPQTILCERSMSCTTAKAAKGNFVVALTKGFEG